MLNQQHQHIRVQSALHSRRSFLAAAAAGLTLRPAFAAPQDLAALTLKAASELVRRKGVSPVELTQACLHRIDRYNSTLNAFITVTGEQALKSARLVAPSLVVSKYPISLKTESVTGVARR
jgi:hypothetical protein